MVFDGGMGTMIQSYFFEEDDFRGTIAYKGEGVGVYVVWDARATRFNMIFCFVVETS